MLCQLLKAQLGKICKKTLIEGYTMAKIVSYGRKIEKPDVM